METTSPQLQTQYSLKTSTRSRTSSYSKSVRKRQ
nr:MAG: hypothetical protein [Owegonang virus 33]